MGIWNGSDRISPADDGMLCGNKPFMQPAFIKQDSGKNTNGGGNMGYIKLYAHIYRGTPEGAAAAYAGHVRYSSVLSITAPMSHI